MRNWCLGSVGLLLAIVVLLPSSCRPPELAISVYTPAGKTYDYDQLRFSLVQPDETRAPNPGTWRSNASVQKINETKAVDLNTFDCKPYRLGQAEHLLPGPLGRLLLPYMEVRGLKGEKTVVSGRFSLVDACRHLQARIFLSPPNEAVRWRPFEDRRQDKDNHKRVGHQITRLPDGRYLVTGGLRTFALSKNGFVQFDDTDFVSAALLYNPATGTLEEIPGWTLKRAFHSATVTGNALTLIGGISSKGTLAPLKVLPLPSVQGTDLKTVASEPPTPPKNIPGRVFHTLLDLQQLKNEQVQNQLMMFGGWSFYPGNPPSEDASKSLHLLFHTATYLPSRKSVLILGGIRWQKGVGFSTNGAGLELGLDGKIRSSDVSMLRLRAGHSAVEIADNEVLVLGGFQTKATRDEKAFLELDGIHDTIEIIRLSSDGKSWASSLSSEIPSLSRRAFHSAVRLPGVPVRMVVTGGIADRGWEKLNETSFVLEMKEGRPDVVSQWLDAEGRFMHSASLFSTGQVFLFGGLKAGVREGVDLRFGVADNPVLLNIGAGGPQGVSSEVSVEGMGSEKVVDGGGGG